jgi:hypothetical protein
MNNLYHSTRIAVDHQAQIRKQFVEESRSREIAAAGSSPTVAAQVSWISSTVVILFSSFLLFKILG